MTGAEREINVELTDIGFGLTENNSLSVSGDADGVADKIE